MINTISLQNNGDSEFFGAVQQSDKIVDRPIPSGYGDISFGLFIIVAIWFFSAIFWPYKRKVYTLDEGDLDGP